MTFTYEESKSMRESTSDGKSVVLMISLVMPSIQDDQQPYLKSSCVSVPYDDLNLPVEILSSRYLLPSMAFIKNSLGCS